MVIGSHNSWSFLKPKKWWMKLIGFTARCQRVSFASQFYAGARCFDLRVRFSDVAFWSIVHGPVEYAWHNGCYWYDIHDDLRRINDCHQLVFVRVILDLRSKQGRQNKEQQIKWFKEICRELEDMYPYIKFWCGRILPDWTVAYRFSCKPTCEEKYASVCKPKWLDDWWPWLYARLHNRKNLTAGTDKDILLIDYVDIK